MAHLLMALHCAAVLLLAAGPPTPRSAPPASTAAPPRSQVTSRPPATASVAAIQQAAPKQAPAQPDSTLERAIQARFARSKISTNGFTVRVLSGVAILEGSTGVIQHKGTATRLAKRAGAKRIDNRIQISEAARQRAAATLARVTRK